MEYVPPGKTEIEAALLLCKQPHVCPFA